jgi:hypothetical protein
MISAAEQQLVGWPLPAAVVDSIESMRRRVAMLRNAFSSEGSVTGSLHEAARRGKASGNLKGIIIGRKSGKEEVKS